MRLEEHAYLATAWPGRVACALDLHSQIRKYALFDILRTG